MGRTVGMSDPAHKTHEFHEKRDGRVRSNPLFWRSFRGSKKMKINVAYGKRLSYRICVMSEAQ
jgi:hypothetical protein